MNTTKSIKFPCFNWFHKVKYEYLVAGVSGGLTSTLILHPLDLIKIRFSAHDGRSTVPKYRNTLHAFLTIFKQEGFFGLYRGVGANLCGAGCSWGLYFLFYNSIKVHLQDDDVSKPLKPLAHLFASYEAGFITMLIMNPVWVVKTRMCLEYDVKSNVRYNGLIDGLVKLIKTEGIRGYYKGIIPGIFGVTHGAVQFMIYEELKNKMNQYKNLPITTKLSNVEYVTYAAISKLIASAVTFPYQLVRTRLQSHVNEYSGTWDCIKKTAVNEGWRGFYKGLRANLIKVTPATMITFVTYENVLYFLLNRH